MARPDLNLLVTLDVLLAEGSVARAAKRLRLSPSAMSRALARIRQTLGDPLLVRAGRGLVPTPRALELRDRVSELVAAAETMLRPTAALDPAQLQRVFTIMSSEGFAENFGPALLDAIGRDAPGVRLRFAIRPDGEAGSLRDDVVDLATGVVGETTSPELVTQALFRDRFIGVVRRGHPLGDGNATLAAYLTAKHILVSRRGRDEGPVDRALAALGERRQMGVTVSGFSAALGLARETDLVATVPERHTAILRAGMHSFPFPIALPEVTVSLLWHPRLDADPAHRWLRACVRSAVADVLDHAKPNRGGNTTTTTAAQAAKT